MSEKVTIEISKETFENLKDQLGVEESGFDLIDSYEDFIGKKIFVRTVTYHMVGLVSKVKGNLMFLTNAAWVADSGRFMDCIKYGKLNEVEPVGDWFINTSTIVDGCIWKSDLPKDQK